MGPKFWISFTRTRRCISNAQGTARLKYQCTTRHTISIALLARVYLNMDYYSCFTGVGGRRRFIKLCQIETKSQNQWHILFGTHSSCCSGTHYSNISGCRRRYGFDRLSQMFGNYVGYALAYGSARIRFSINT